MKKDVEGVIRKRTLIAKTRKTVLIWVGGAAFVVAAAAVAAILLVQTIIFNESEVIKPKNETVKQLEANIAAIPDLKADVRVLDTNPQLKVVSVRDGSRALQSILDALPADDNRLALGASLQQKLLSDSSVPGLSVDSLSVDPSAGGGQVFVEDQLEGGLQELAFTASISGEAEALKVALQRLEKSIRAINIKSINATSAGSSTTLQITGVAYYLPAPSLELTKKTVRQSQSAPQSNSSTTNTREDD